MRNIGSGLAIVLLSRLTVNRGSGVRRRLEKDISGRCVDAVNLKHVLGDIQPDRGDLHVEGSLM
jgi:hypothetical protein